MNPLELAAVALIILVAASYLLRRAVAKHADKSKNSCGGCHCGKGFAAETILKKP
ncbi:MAG: FeoB-associated Cys-rich membrane protein [Terrimicrobiaceae bacterium]